MFYDVTINRISTATKTIRVEADDPDSARGMALELAGDQDFSGCVTDYDFECSGASEAKD